MKTFKSPIAAKCAVTRATRAYEAARNVRINRFHEAVAGGVGEFHDADMAPFIAAEDTARAAMVAAYSAATDQGFYVACYHLETNATRDLIAANMD